jgi:hypothetical protein
MLMLICAKNEIFGSIRPSISKSKIISISISKSCPLAFDYAYAFPVAYFCFGSQTKIGYD